MNIFIATAISWLIDKWKDIIDFVLSYIIKGQVSNVYWFQFGEKEDWMMFYIMFEIV